MELQPADRYETVTTPLWRFDRHPNKTAILEKHRDWNVGDGYEWWDGVYDQLQNEWKVKGVEVEGEHMYFRGFWSQGDGACFDDCHITWDKLWPHLTGSYPMLSQYKGFIPNVSLHHSSFYSHEYSVSICLDSWRGEEEIVYEAISRRLPKMKRFIGNEFIWELERKFGERVREEFIDLEAEVTELLREKMRDMYRRLEQEYNYLQSDECLSDYFGDSDHLFAEDGTLH